MKLTKSYATLIMTMICLTCSMMVFGQWGITVPETDCSFEELKKYHEECKRIKKHNEWVYTEENRLKKGQQMGACMILIGFGLISVGGVIRKQS